MIIKPPEPPSMRRRPVVLVADDDPHVRFMLCRRLEQEGYQPVPCPKGKDALRLARTLSPNFIVLDAHLGDLDGFEVCARLKQSEGTEAIPVLMISGTFVDREHHRQAIKSGAIDYLRKPLDWELVKLALRKVLAGTARTQDQELGRAGTVLVADDEDDWLKLVTVWLVDAGFRVICTPDHRKVEELALKERPDCIVLDYLFTNAAAETTAADICRQLQVKAELRAIPVVVLTGQEAKKYTAMNKGADHFVVKDGRSQDLLAAVQASVRRKGWSAGILVKGDLRLDPRDHTVCLDGRPRIELTNEQFKVLYALVEAGPKSVSRETLFHVALSEIGKPDESKALEQLLTRLKRRLGKSLASRIVNVKDEGWLYLSGK